MAESITIVPRRKRGDTHASRSADRAVSPGGGLQSLLLASAYFNTGRYGEAKEAMDRAVLVMGRRRPSQQADVLYLRGQITWISDRDAAIRDWEEAVRLDPKHERAKARLRAPDVPPSPPNRF